MKMTMELECEKTCVYRQKTPSVILIFWGIIRQNIAIPKELQLTTVICVVSFRNELSWLMCKQGTVVG